MALVSRLAIMGGTPVRSGAYPSGPWIDAAERDGVLRCLDSKVLSGFVATSGPEHYGGPEVRGLEEVWRGLGQYSGVVAVNSATAALHAGLVGMDLPPGSEVVVPPLTMSATVAAVVMAGLRPRFADVDGEIFTLTAETVAPSIGSRTSALLPVHLFGQMAPMDELRGVADNHGLRILEDAAQSPGATQCGVWPGHGTAGAAFSFNQHKVITCGEGGLLASERPDVLLRAQLVRNHGESVVGGLEGVDPDGFIGNNYRLTELCAAVARSQTDKLGQLNGWRRERAERLSNMCREIAGIECPTTLPGNSHVYFTYALRFREEEWGCTRATFSAALRAEGVPCQEGYVAPLYRLPMFDRVRSRPEFRPENYPNAERLSSRELVLLPVCQFPAGMEDIDRVGVALNKCWDQRAALVAWNADKERCPSQSCS